MRKVELDQGSQAWLDWRKGLLTATDAAMLLGVSPYVTPFMGYQRKIGEIPEQTVNSAMLRGQRDEPRARSLFIEKYGINMTPCCVESDDYNFIGASLDGISDCGRFILEVKSQNIEEIKFSGIPEFHKHQIHHQFLSTDSTAELCYYVTIWGDEIYVIKVFPDTDWMKNYIPKAKEFWKGIVFREPPPLTNKDYKDMNATPLWDSYSTEYKKVCEQINVLEDLKQLYRRELISMCEDQSCSGSGIKVMKKSIKGRIDYKEVLDILNIPDKTIELYRKPPSFSWAIMVD